MSAFTWGRPDFASGCRRSLPASPRTNVRLQGWMQFFYIHQYRQPLRRTMVVQLRI
ncbi:hypothetical protein KCP71_20645 [Salmonella enterica subsp. enterica]|nr:hypothetical protein KCP71_20645 [Salmonella enterica subsp. enterica]